MRSDSEDLFTMVEHINATNYNFSQPHRLQYSDTVYELLPKNLAEGTVDMSGDPTTHTIYMLATRYLSH